MTPQPFYQTLPALLRWRLSLAIASSALAVFLYHGAVPAWRAVFLFAGVLLLAAAASAINQYQEQRVDSLMKRTNGRPLPQGRIGNGAALLIALIALLPGLFLVFFKTPPAAGVVALAALVWYNAVYTPLKQRSRYAVFAGAITGALPPMIGWIAAGEALNTSCMVICLFMYLWQIVHFLLLQLRYGHEYEEAGIPSLGSLMSRERLRIAAVVWVLATAACALLFPVFKILTTMALLAMLIIGAGLFVFFSYRTLSGKVEKANPGPALLYTYLFQGLVSLLLVAEGLIGGPA